MSQWLITSLLKILTFFNFLFPDHNFFKEKKWQFSQVYVNNFYEFPVIRGFMADLMGSILL